jgi:hypothetical protein
LEKHVRGSAWVDVSTRPGLLRKLKTLGNILNFKKRSQLALGKRKFRRWKVLRRLNWFDRRLRNRFLTKRVLYTIVSLAAFLGIISILYSAYQLYQSDELDRQRDLIESVRSKLDQATHSFDQYLELLSHRIQAHSSDLQILEMLREHFGQYAAGPFPVVLSLTYLPLSTDRKPISRLGYVDKLAISPGHLLSGSGRECDFVIQKEVTSGGALRAHLSFENIVPDVFVKDDSDESKANTQKLTTKIGQQEVMYRLEMPVPSVSGFVHKNYGFIILVAITAFGSCLFGSGLNFYAMRKKNKNLVGETNHYRSQNNKLKLSFADLESQLSQKSKEYQQLQSKAERREEMLHFTLESYRQTARHWLSSCDTLAALLPAMQLQETISSQLLTFVSRIDSIFKKMSSGLPFPQKEHYVYVDDLVEECVALFEGHRVKFETSNQLRGQLEEPLAVDDGILRIVLYNLFRFILNKFCEAGTVKVEIRYENGVEISLMDNGSSRQPIENRNGSSNTFELCIKEVTELAQDSGWVLKFISGSAKNTCTLFLPDHNLSRGNVVSLFELKKNA